MFYACPMCKQQAVNVEVSATMTLEYDGTLTLETFDSLPERTEELSDDTVVWCSNPDCHHQGTLADFGDGGES